MNIKVILLISVIWMSACRPTQGISPNEPGTVPPDTAVTSPPQDGQAQEPEPVNNPYAPKPEDADLIQGEVFLDKMDLLIRESYPPQISLNLSGNLPTPCHQLRVQINEPDDNNKINVDAYSVADPDQICVQVLEPFEASIDMGTYPGGHYSVWVNGEPAGEFDS